MDYINAEPIGVKSNKVCVTKLGTFSGRSAAQSIYIYTITMVEAAGPASMPALRIAHMMLPLSLPHLLPVAIHFRAVRLREELQEAIVVLLQRSDFLISDFLIVAPNRPLNAIDGPTHGMVLQPLDSEIQRTLPAPGDPFVIAAQLVVGGSAQARPFDRQGDRGSTPRW